MRNRTTAIGALLGTAVGLAWGGQFVVGKSALGTINAFPLTTIRYAVAALLWLAVLAAIEGRRSLRLDGRGLRLFWLGTLGFAGFNLLAYTGLAHARPESASLIVALSPLLTALVLWRRSGKRPATPTLVLLGVALAGVALVISNGNPVSIFDGAIGWGDLLVLGGVFSFVLYGLGAQGFRDFSPLRYTALTAGLGWLVARSRNSRRDRGRARRHAVREPAHLGRPADRLPRDPRRLRGRPRLERRDQAPRSAERQPVREPDPGHDVRDRDRPRVPPGSGSSRRSSGDGRRACCEQPGRALHYCLAVAADAGAKRKSRKRRYIGGGLGIAVVVLTFVFVLPRIANYREVWDVVQDLTWPQIGALLLATLLNLATYAPPWQAALPGLSYRHGTVLTLASTASTYVAPGGAAVGMAASYAMLRAWKFERAPIALAVTITGIWNQFAMLGFPIVALALLTLQNERNALLETVALIGLAIFVVAVAAFAVGLAKEGFTRRVGDLAARIASWGLHVIRRKPVTWTGESFVRFRASAIELLRRRWLLLTVTTLAGQLTVFGVMLVSLRVTGVSGSEVSLIEAFAAWSIVRLLGSLPVTPGGIGIVEVGLTGALVGFGGHNAEVVAAVLVYRALTIVPTLVLGSIAGASWKHFQPADPL